MAAVDAAAKTFTVGSKTIKVTDQTKITNKGAAATMAEIVADEQVRGSYWKKEDGTMEAKSVKLGPKSAEAKPMTDAAKPMPDAQKKEGTRSGDAGSVAVVWWQTIRKRRPNEKSRLA